MKRAEYMSTRDRQKLGTLPRSHENCKATTGKFRPGKTAKDRAMKGGEK